MIALDSSSLMAFLEGAAGGDIDLVERSLSDRQACLPPVVLTEILSDPKLPRPLEELLLQLPRLDVVLPKPNRLLTLWRPLTPAVSCIATSSPAISS